MFEETLETTLRFPANDSSGALPSAHDFGPDAELHALILGGSSAQRELPPLPDLIAAAIALAEGTRRKSILPVGRSPVELALVRHGAQVSIDGYGTESTPEILLRERTIELQSLLEACVSAARSAARRSGDTTMGRALASLAARAAQTRVAPDLHPELGHVSYTGGSLANPGADVPLSFGFEAKIPRAYDSKDDQHAFADVHALLFEGELWAFSGERRVSLVRGPIMLAAQRMVCAVRALIDAWQAERPLHVRLLAGGFSIAVRRETHGAVSLSMSTERHGILTWPALDVPSASLPVLRLVSDLLRKLVAVDRSQSHNLRVTALRNEVRALRGAIRGRKRQEGFENLHPERLRLSVSESSAGGTPAHDAQPLRGRLRYTERWSAEIDALDASGVFLCGERLIVATPKLTLALSSSNGGVLWSQPTARATTLLVGRSLVRLLPDGGSELCDVEEGHVYARTDRSLKLHGSPFGLFAGGGDLPPVAILREAGQRLVAIDLRTGEPRWRFRARGHGGFGLRRAGRVLLVACGDGSIDALDVASGEAVWRFADRGRFCLAPALFGELAVAVSGEPGGGAGVLYGLELYTGKLLWKHTLSAAPSGEPIATEQHVIVPTGGSRDASLHAFAAHDGMQRWTCHDPGLDNGGKSIEVDGALIVNTPSGRLTAIDLENGQTRFTRSLANPLTDDVPRQLQPILRHGALFVPSAQVHVLRPSDGTPLTNDVGCDLVPDLLRVDERGQFFVAEESGHLRAYASAPQLLLVK